MSKILVIDDAPEMTQFLEHVLRREGHEVTTAQSAWEGLKLAHQFRPDLVVLDVMMPQMDGWEALQRLREFSDVPVIMLTAVDGVDNKVLGLDYGADDYITKPFEVQELKARIRSILRRASIPTTTPEERLSFDGGRLILDPPARQVLLNGEPISLTPTEYKLLLCLARHAGRVLTYDQILDRVWGPGYENSVSIIKVYIRRLRKKIEPEPHRPRYLLTRWGVGYSMAKI